MRLSRTDALTLLREALATLPSELDARADFFVQWRARTIHNLELIFPDRPEIVGQFKEIEFSPRRLTNKDTRDEQLKLDAFLSGCVAARAQLEELVRQLLASLDAVPAQHLGEGRHPKAMVTYFDDVAYRTAVDLWRQQFEVFLSIWLSMRGTSAMSSEEALLRGPVLDEALKWLTSTWPATRLPELAGTTATP